MLCFYSWTNLKIKGKKSFFTALPNFVRKLCITTFISTRILPLGIAPQTRFNSSLVTPVISVCGTCICLTGHSENTPRGFYYITFFFRSLKGREILFCNTPSIVSLGRHLPELFESYVVIVKLERLRCHE